MAVANVLIMMQVLVAVQINAVQTTTVCAVQVTTQRAVSTNQVKLNHKFNSKVGCVN